MPEFPQYYPQISHKLPKPERKFIADMNYGMLASNSCLLTDIEGQLHEPSKKINIVDCLSRHLAKGIADILPYAKQGIRFWIRTKRPAYRQFYLKLTV